MKHNSQLTRLISDKTQKDIYSLFKKTDDEKEFEFIFFSKNSQGLTKEKYILVLKYFRNIVRQNNYVIVGPETSLDISLQSDDSTYRISVNGIQHVASVIEQFNHIPNKNHLIFKFAYQLMKKDKNNAFTFINKKKSTGATVNVDEVSLRVRLATETDVSNADSYAKVVQNILAGKSFTLDELQTINKNIVFRLKERISVYILKEDNCFIKIDLTDTKTTPDVKNIRNVPSNYELEVEYGANKKAIKDEHLVQIYDVSENLLKLVHQSNFLMTQMQTNAVIEFYSLQLGLNEKAVKLYARQSVSLEIQHVTELLPNKYAVTDKADGDRHHLIIYQNGAYIIDDNLNVRDTGIRLDKKLDKFNGTILDGEYIFIPKQKRHMFLVFDCLKKGDTSLIHENKLQDRLEDADDVIEKCFVFGDQTGFKFKSPPKQTKGFEIDVLRNFYGTELSRFYEHLNRDGSIAPMFPLIRRKYFMFVFGAAKWEIFDYSVEFWKRYTEDSTVKAPYLLDGLIYQPTEQSYVINAAESKYHDYKWKPPQKNSIDFYIEFKRDDMTGEILDVYDNSDEDMVKNKTYKICNLYVGKAVGDIEQPVLFDQNFGISYAYIYLDDNGDARDINGDIISDKTVVEFYYQNDLNIIPQRRWVPIKTRYDKTESVEKYGRKYGNYAGIALRIWRSIVNPVLMSDFIDLAKGNTTSRNFYDIKIKDMNSKISHSLIVTATKENKYYQKQTKLAETMRHFHNFIKSNLIYTYCNKTYQSNTQQSVLDIACGRGGDILKFYYCEVAFYVGFDADVDGIKSPIDGAVSRYNMLKRKKPNVPKMYFVQADATALLDVESQLKTLGSMEDTNKHLLEKLFPVGDKHTFFDRINCQFAIHYFLRDDIAWKNFKYNVNRFLRNGGYLIGTTFDAQQVLQKFGTSNSITVMYDDQSGVTKTFFDIKRKFSELNKSSNDTIGIGNAIDVFATWMFNEGNYVTEYLVDINFLIDELSRDCDMELVDTDLFSNQFLIHKDFICDAAQYENVYETRKFLGKEVAEYYQNTDINKKCLEFSNMTRYFIFRKKYSDKQKGGAYEPEWDFSDPKKFKIPNMDNYNNNFSFLNSLHKILVSHKIIPKHLEINEFLKDMDLSAREDINLDAAYISNIRDNIIVKHDILDKKKRKLVKVINKLNIYVVERDCNNFYDVDFWDDDKHSASHAIVLMKNGTNYMPIMRRNDNENIGLFSHDDAMIKYLNHSGTSLYGT